MDDRPWIREDTLTLQLAIPPLTHVQKAHI